MKTNYFQLLVLVVGFLSLLLVAACSSGGGGDDDDDNATDDDSGDDDVDDGNDDEVDDDATDDDTTDDDAADDDTADDDTNAGSPPVLKDPYIFPDVPAGPDRTLALGFSICDPDGDLNSSAYMQVYWVEGDVPWYEEGIPVWSYIQNSDVSDCSHPLQAYFWTWIPEGWPADQYDAYIVWWDDAGNQSEPLNGFTFWIPDSSGNAPVISNAGLTNNGNETITLDFNICDLDNDLIGGNLSFIYPMFSGGKRVPTPALDAIFLSWDGRINGDQTDCENPASVSVNINMQGFDPGEYCFDLMGTDVEHHPSNYVMDLCVTL